MNKNIDEDQKIKLKYHYFRQKIIKLSAISKNKANPIKHFETAHFDYISLTITSHNTLNTLTL